MKNTILLLTFSCLTGASITRCKTPNQRAEASRDNLASAQNNAIPVNEALPQSQEIDKEDINNNRIVAAEKMEGNKECIDTLNTCEQADKADYDAQVAKWERKNREIEMKMDAYEVSDQENWDAFKAGLNRDINRLGESLKALTAKSAD
jgi:hypothetical protein